MFGHLLPSRNSSPVVLLREGGKHRKKTIANLSRCPREKSTTSDIALASPKDHSTCSQ
jgi:hypothetical protein